MDNPRKEIRHEDVKRITEEFKQKKETTDKPLKHDEEAYKEHIRTEWDNADPRYMNHSKRQEYEADIKARFPNRPKISNNTGGIQA